MSIPGLALAGRSPWLRTGPSTLLGSFGQLGWPSSPFLLYNAGSVIVESDELETDAGGRAPLSLHPLDGLPDGCRGGQPACLGLYLQVLAACMAARQCAATRGHRSRTALLASS